MADQEQACEARAHRFGHALVSEGKPATCHCGGVHVEIVNGRVVYTMTHEAMLRGGLVEHADVPGYIGSGYSLSWGKRDHRG